MSSVVVLPLDAQAYACHALHRPERVWVEKNCYVDLWIEMLHALRLDPTACLSFTVAVDFEGDQWTFFKPSHDELRSLYGIEVQELDVWRPLAEHAREHVAAGKWLLPEVDAFWLPDTTGTDYRRGHAKTTIALNELDFERRRLGYFHNAGYFVLEGEDFDALWRGASLPPYVELVRLDRAVYRDAAELRGLAREALRRHLARRPAANPVARFAKRLAVDLPVLQEAGLDTYHRWAFSGIRQCGAAFELAALHLAWMDDPALAPAVEPLMRIAEDCKTLILKAARAVSLKRPLDAGAQLDGMASAWGAAMHSLATALQ